MKPAARRRALVVGVGLLVALLVGGRWLALETAERAWGVSLPGGSAYLVARDFAHEEVLQFLMERTPEDVKLTQACELGDEGAFRALLATTTLCPALSSKSRMVAWTAISSSTIRIVATADPPRRTPALNCL